MIGFQPQETDIDYNNSMKSDAVTKPGEKEVPAPKPGIEIPSPNPSSVPSPQPDTIENSPKPEIQPIPAENPTPSTVPEISPIQPVEFS